MEKTVIENKKNKTNNALKLLSVFAVISIFLMSTCFAALNQELSISGEAYLRIGDVIRVASIAKSDQSGGGYETYNPKYNKDEVSMFATLPNENSTVSYTIVIENLGSKVYLIDDLVENKTNNNLLYAVPEELIGTIIKPGERHTITIKIETSKSNQSGEINIKYIFKELGDKESIFEFKEEPQIFDAPIDGIYKIELWGAQGASYNATYAGGRGAYASGETRIKPGEKLYVYVGGSPEHQSKDAGYNGGGAGKSGSNHYGYAGGGATDVRLKGGEWNNEESLASRIMIAAGGGGAGSALVNGKEQYGKGGAGGALIGYVGTDSTQTTRSNYIGSGGDQVMPGYNYEEGDLGKNSGSFGKGGTNKLNNYGGAGGGAGLWGGAASSRGHAGAGGGSSYVSGYTGSVGIVSSTNINPKEGCSTGTRDNSCSVHYSGYKFDNPEMVAGNSLMPNHTGSDDMLGNMGNGYVRITLIRAITEEEEPDEPDEPDDKVTYEFDFVGDSQIFKAPSTKRYQIELWGAQGTNYDDEFIGGKGAYVSGEIELKEGDELYVYVGEHASNKDYWFTYNGGGFGNYGDEVENFHEGYSGGGATDVRVLNTYYEDEEGYRSRIMVAAGGGGAAFAYDYKHGIGGAGGTLTGLNGSGDASDSEAQSGTGGTQTAGGYSIEEKIKGGFYNNGMFGSGGINLYFIDGKGGAGGGGGYYGGGGSTSGHGGAGGGSSYISGHTGCVAVKSQKDKTPKSGCSDGTTNQSCSVHYSNKQFTNTKMIDGNSEMPNPRGSGTIIGNTGHGYARITELD